MVENIVPFIIYIAFLGFTARRLLTYLHPLQQEDYDTDRLIKWIFANRVFDKRLSLGLLATGILAFFIPRFFTESLTFAALCAALYIEKDPRRNSKKKLVMTARVKRIFSTSLAVGGFFGLAGFLAPHPWFWVLGVQLVPVFLIAGNIFLNPFEKTVQQKFWNEAHAKIERLKPIVIGITGSFGKTSVKHILGHILKTQAGTLVTPGSVNTPMGISRIIREDLDESHKFFVVEMGAYGPGSIERLCKLTPPYLGVITAIGHAHYERFKTLDTVAHTKYELARAAIDNMGKVVVHEKTLRFEEARKIREANPSSFIVCGEPVDPRIVPKEISYLAEGDLHIQKVSQKRDGLEVKIKWKGESHIIKAPLYGLHHGHNIVLALAAADALGIPLPAIITALKSVPQIPHRLEVSKLPGNVTLIDDAYNSNPLGFRSALELLGTLKIRGRAILVTPGIVELGTSHDEIHKQLGLAAADICDIIIAVSPKRIPSFVEAAKSKGKPVETFDTFQEAQAWLDRNKRDGDIILLENDLPDLYERIPKI